MERGLEPLRDGFADRPTASVPHRYNNKVLYSIYHYLSESIWTDIAVLEAQINTLLWVLGMWWDRLVSRLVRVG